MAQGNRATLLVHLRGVKTKSLLDSLADGSESLVDLPYGDILNLQAGALEDLGDGESGSEREVDGGGSGISRGNDAGGDVGVAPEGLEDRLGSENEGRGAVGEGRGVGSGDCAVLLEGGAERAHLGRVDGLVLLVDGDDGGALAGGDAEGLNLGVEGFGVPGGLCAAVGLEGVLILLLAGDAELLCGVFGAVAHVDLVVDVPKAVLDETVLGGNIAEGGGIAGEVTGHLGHVFHTTGNLSLSETELDVLGGQRDGLQAGSADLVDCDSLNRLRESSTNDNLASWGLASTTLEDMAKVEVGNLVGGDLGAGEGGLDDVGTESGSGGVLEGAVELGDRS